MTTATTTTTETKNTPGAGSYIAACIFPIVGVILAIIAFARGQVGPGFGLAMTSFFAWIVWIAVLAS